jgi:transposase
MRTGISLTVTPAIRRHLKAVAANRNSPQKHVWRAQIVLLSAAGVGTNEIMRQTGKSKTCVWRWQERFMAEGFDGLLHDKTRPSRVGPLGADVAERVVALTQSDPPAETTHWTAPMMAKEIGISASSVQRIWHAHGLQPHRFRRFKLSNDPNFVEKLRDVVGLYVDPPAHAIAWRLPIRRRSPGSHQSTPRRNKLGAKALHMDRGPGQNHRRRQTRAPSVRFHPLGAKTASVIANRRMSSRSEPERLGSPRSPLAYLRVLLEQKTLPAVEGANLWRRQ